MISLEQLLKARDERCSKQKKLLEAFPGRTLVCLTVQFPGPVKRSRNSLIVGGAGLAALLDRFGSVLSHVQVRDLPSGYEAYLLLPLPAVAVKRICCEIEQTHPLGRLMDIDVLTLEDGSPVPLDRSSLGLGERTCLLCPQPARYCMRARTHSLEELLGKIETMINEYSECQTFTDNSPGSR